MVRSIGICGLTEFSAAAFPSFTEGSIKKLIGRPIRRCAAAQAKQVSRQPIRSRPSAVSGQPTVRGKARDQRDAGDRGARGLAIDAPERAERRVVEAISHADAEQQPGCDQDRNRVGDAEQREPGRERQVGDRQHRPAADQVDLAADARAEHGRNHQRRREGGKDPVRGNPEVVRDRIGEDRRQIIAGGPGQRLGGAERQDDRILTPAHRSRTIIIACCTRTRPCHPASHLHPPRNRRQPPILRGHRSNYSASAAADRLQTPVSGSTSSTRSAASRSPASSAAIERTCSYPVIIRKVGARP